VVGLGYVGLPLVRAFAHSGYGVLGFDIDASKVNKLNKGISYIHHIPDQLIRSLRKKKKFEATDDFARASEVDALILCVPTPLTQTREPDVSYLVNTARAIAPYLQKKQIVVLESTTYPGTTEELILPILEEGSGLCAGKDFYLAYSPEREDPGNPDYATCTIPKVVGGIDKQSTRLAEALYASIVTEVVVVSNTRVAEACKLLENIYRCVNIAMVNELKMIFDRMDINVWEVIQAAATKPFGFQPFYPGPGLGGHCIPIDPFYLSWKAREFGAPAQFIELAGVINTAMPDYVMNKLTGALNTQGKALNNATILVIGASYKKNVDDTRESPSLELMARLQKKGARVSYHDPYVPVLPATRKHQLELKSVPLTPNRLRLQDAVLIATDHDCLNYDFIAKHAKLVLDTRNAVKTTGKTKAVIFKA